MSKKVSGFSAREFYMTEMKTKRVASRSTGNTEIEEAEFSMWTQIALSCTNLTSPVAIMKREKET